TRPVAIAPTLTVARWQAFFAFAASMRWRYTVLHEHVHPPEHPDPSVLPHDAGDALPVSAAPAGDQARHRALGSGCGVAARHADRRRIQALSSLRLQAVVRWLPVLRTGAHPGA